MAKNPAKEASVLPGFGFLATPWPRSYLNFVGRKLFRLAELVKGLGAFSLITLGVTLSQWNKAVRVIHPLIRAEIYRAGVRLLPIIAFMGFALGFVVIGQTVSLLTRVGASNYAGTVMVMVVVRELGPIATALLVLARVGTATVIELGTVRAMGEVEALEALGIDPIHYLVVPRVIGLAIAIFSLTVYFILITLFSGYLFAFFQDVALLPGQYVGQLARALRWEDFVLLILKTLIFGVTIAVVTCYEGLAKPLRQEEIAEATTRAVVQGVELTVLLDALFILFLLF
ncbi:MAG: ABC transporter permease [Candidatus Omnitrophica bacterium]|nr:ABC transporter permease [Candidatus Omnitrophota bacterium]